MSPLAPNDPQIRPGAAWTGAFLHGPGAFLNPLRTQEKVALRWTVVALTVDFPTLEKFVGACKWDCCGMHGFGCDVAITNRHDPQRFHREMIRLLPSHTIVGIRMDIVENPWTQTEGRVWQMPRQ
jgi:hypothetical protein